MEPTFIYYKDLAFGDELKFSIDFSDKDLLEAVVFKKNKCYYITSLACYVDLTVDITELSNCKFLILQLQLRGDVVFDMVEMN